MSAFEMCQIHGLTLIELAAILDSDTFKLAAESLEKIANARQAILEPESRALASARLSDILKDKPTTPAHAETQRKCASSILKAPSPAPNQKNLLRSCQTDNPPPNPQPDPEPRSVTHKHRPGADHTSVHYMNKPAQMTPATAAPTRYPAPWRSGDHPDTIACSALLYPDEIAYLHWAGSQAAISDGAIIDLGAFLGGSSLTLAIGSACTDNKPPHIHAYDPFRVSPTQCGAGQVPGRAGDSYLGIYKSNLHAHLGRITIHEGYIDPWAQHADELDAIYPTREPVSLLFIDCAKAWGVHHSILRAFGPHLSNGSIVIQQDFQNTFVYLAIHMYQLRGVLKPAHFPDGGSIGFIANAPISSKDLDALWTPQDLERLGRDKILTEVASWFDATTPEPIGGWVWLAAAATPEWLDDHDFIESCIDRAGRARETIAKAPANDDDQTQTQAQTRIRNRIENWNGECRRLSALLRNASLSVLADRALEEMLITDERDKKQTDPDDSESFAGTWDQIETHCRTNGYHRIALFCAGRHTIRLLSHAWPTDPDLEVVAIIDENPHKAGFQIAGIPIVRPEDALNHNPDIVIPSTDAHESNIWSTCCTVAEQLHVPSCRVYSRQ